MRFAKKKDYQTKWKYIDKLWNTRPTDYINETVLRQSIREVLQMAAMMELIILLTLGEIENES